ncbi:hypothetical protein ACFVXC_28655, partial [Streptomyces sp. NPDC058257]|uniref:hypothetical protein n=1 Tax=Streptomyces sp. NPDC058257 TaxID=3346409 RepID=UPI0036EFD698
MPEFELAELDYELQRESANVVNTPKGKGPQRPPELKSEPETERKSDLVELETQEQQEQNETPKGSARRKAREGEYKGSVRS